MLGHQQDGRQDQGVDNGDREDANGKAAVVIVKVGAEHIAKSRDDEIKAAGHHQRGPLETPGTGSNDQIQISPGGNTPHEADRHRGDQSSRHRTNEQQRNHLWDRDNRSPPEQRFQRQLSAQKSEHDESRNEGGGEDGIPLTPLGIGGMQRSEGDTAAVWRIRARSSTTARSAAPDRSASAAPAF
jgi:hypothetical protein